MKAHLLHRDRDVDFTIDRVRWYHEVHGPAFTTHDQALVQDLELDTVLDAMAANDQILREIAKRVLLRRPSDVGDILYRQQVLADCLRQRKAVREMLAITLETIDDERQVHGAVWQSPQSVLRRSVQGLGVLVDGLKRLRQVADTHADQFTSEGFASFFSMISTELDDQYFAAVDEQLDRLRLKDGVLMSAQLGQGLKPTGYVLRTPEASKVSLKEKLGMAPRTEHHWDLPPRDEAGGRMLSEIANRGVNLVANALAQSIDHVKSFFFMLWIDLGFYVGCINLYEALNAKAVPLCMPEPLPWDVPGLSYTGIRDPCLALRSDTPVVGNDADASGCTLVMITGANSGGKSTLLRGIGLAQLMTQAGMFVAAHSFATNVSVGMFTHFIREEDEAMRSGKLDEELARMQAIATELRPGCVVLFNESFAATNEREGSEIAGTIVDALLDSGVRVVFVTHQFTLARRFHDQRAATTLFLRAERGGDGRRTYEVRPGEPLRTAFGEDLYRRIGGLSPHDLPPNSTMGPLRDHQAAPAPPRGSGAR